MFKNLGWPEIAIIVVVILILFGANFLPKVGKNLGTSEKEIKKAAKDFKKVVVDKEDK